MPINEFINTFDNKMSLVHIYDKDGVEIDKSSTSIIGSGMEVTLELDNNTIDRLLVVVKGDANGDGLITAVDVATLNDVVLGKDSTWFSLVTTDVNADAYTTAVDSGLVQQVILGLATDIKSQVD